MIYKFIGWSRSRFGKGEVVRYHFKDVCNTVTQFAGGGYGNTTPYVLIEYEL